MDVASKQTVGSVTLERNFSSFLQVMPCRKRDALYCLHENGSVSVRVQQSQTLPVSIPTSPLDVVAPRGVQYELHCQSEPLRISKTCQVFSGTLCPKMEQSAAVLTSEGRILLWDLEFEQVWGFSTVPSSELHVLRADTQVIDGGGLGDRFKCRLDVYSCISSTQAWAHTQGWAHTQSGLILREGSYSGMGSYSGVGLYSEWAYTQGGLILRDGLISMSGLLLIMVGSYSLKGIHLYPVAWVDERSRHQAPSRVHLQHA